MARTGDETVPIAALIGRERSLLSSYNSSYLLSTVGDLMNCEGYIESILMLFSG